MRTHGQNVTQEEFAFLDERNQQERNRNSNRFSVPTPTQTNSELPTKTQPEQPMARPRPQPRQRTQSGTRSNPNQVAARKRTRNLGAPSQIALAPVNIGNTIRGTETRVIQSRDGCTLVGRDFMFTPIGTGSIETWTLAGGAPLTPAAFVDSTLRQYMQMYNKFRFRQITAHYLTSSPTSSDGDIMFYYSKNRESVFLNQTSNNLLPYVISDPNTVLGPQWQNHSATFNVTSDWKSTDYGIDDDLGKYAAGELFLLTRSTTTDSPGYVMFDYVIDFQEHSLIPRLLTLPQTKILWTNVALRIDGPAAVDQSIWATFNGNRLDGSPTQVPPGGAFGDVYKCIIDLSNSTLGANSAFYTSNFIASNTPSASSTLNWGDGVTIYAHFASNFRVTFYPSLTAALSGSKTLNFTGTGVLGANTIQTWWSFAAATTGTNNTPNF